MLGPKAEHKADAEPVAVRTKPSVSDRMSHRADHHLFEPGEACEALSVDRADAVWRRGNQIHRGGKLMALPCKLAGIDRPDATPSSQQALCNRIKAVAQRRHRADAGDRDGLADRLRDDDHAASLRCVTRCVAHTPLVTAARGARRISAPHGQVCDHEVPWPASRAPAKSRIS